MFVRALCFGYVSILVTDANRYSQPPKLPIYNKDKSASSRGKKERKPKRNSSNAKEK